MFISLFSIAESYLVDPASTNMLVQNIKSGTFFEFFLTFKILNCPPTLFKIFNFKNLCHVPRHFPHFTNLSKCSLDLNFFVRERGGGGVIVRVRVLVRT